MKTCLIAIVGTASIVASADAGFLGYVASVRTVGANTVIDIFAGVSNASDKFLNVYNASISTTLAGGFVQKAGLATKTWKPDTAGFTSTRNTIDDSFMTAGTFGGGVYGGEYYASSNTNGDPNFTGTSWNATPGSAAATSVPVSPQYPTVTTGAGWYTGDPTSIDNTAESLAGMIGRVNAAATAASGNTAGSLGGASANFGIWCGHIVVAGNGILGPTGTNIFWTASASIKDGVTGATDQRISSFAVPAPGALALLGIAGFASRRRRA
jgi:MYXO-CTERM domain-containing protein